MEQPLVSIILPTYNGNQLWISESIDSVLTQTYSNFELIIINDASTNEIEETILDYQKKDPRIKYYKNDKNIQLTKTLNRGIGLSNGKYIARIDDDDVWCDKDKLQKQVLFMEENPGYGLCGTGVIVIDESGHETERILNRSGDAKIRRYISGSNQFAHPSVIIRKSTLEDVGLYIDNKNTKYAEDYDLWLRIGMIAKFTNLQEYCIKYRVRMGSITGKKRRHALVNAAKLSIKYIKHYPNPIRGVLTHGVTLLFPKWLVTILVRMSNKIYRKSI